ncbi:MAG TPA: hypothetical protein VFN37_00860 [Candidatus Baltobacteraceae bacterium]|nr:hypothetical protein [Candidatus Baltobacteraceae bacterium]
MTIFALAACAGGGGGPAVPSGGSAQHPSSAVFSISIPARSTARSPGYVSPNTQSLTIGVNGAAPSVTQNVTSSSGGCTSSGTSAASGGGITCSVTVSAPVGSDTFTVTLYSGTNAGGAKLATGSVTATIGSAPTSVDITLDGVVDSVLIGLGNSMPTAGSATTIAVTVMAKDASGATIISPGGYSPAITLQDSDASGHTTLSSTTVPAPGTAITLHYDGSPLISSATISALVTGSITKVTPATLTPQIVENGGGGVAVITIGNKTYAEVPSALGLIQTTIATGGVFPSPSASPESTVLALNPNPDACTIAPNGGKILAYCIAFSQLPASIDVVDLSGGMPVLTGTVATDATQLFSSSGGDCYLCGIAWDPNDSAVLVSTLNGYEFYDPVAGKQSRATIPAPIAENFGYNPATNQIWSPQEQTNNEEEDLVDVAGSTWYAITPSLTSVLREPDAGAVDPTTNVAMSLDEFSGTTAIVPLGGAVLATPAPGANPPGTLTAPLAATNNIMVDSGCETNAISIDPTKHVAFISGEYSSPDCVGAVQLPAAAPTTAFVPASYMWIPQLPNTPDGNTFDSALDPHVAATFYLPGSGDLYGLIFNYSRSYIAVVDITKLLAAPPWASDPHQVDPSYDLFANGVLTYVATGYSPGPSSSVRRAMRHFRRR